MDKLKFYNKINGSTIERQVEDCYNEVLTYYFREIDGITYPYACDGLIETQTTDGNNIKLLMEYKYDLDFSNKVVRAKVITQVLFYLKRFEIDGKELPNVILIGDKNECFVFHTNDIIKYLDEDVDWKTAPSNASEKNPDLVLKISQDENLNPFIFVIDEKFSFDDVYNKIYDLSDNVKKYVHVTEHNISNIFDYFTDRVVKKTKKISPNDIVAIFIGVITNDDDYYIHPKKIGTLVTPFGDVMVNSDQYKSFVEHYNRDYSPQEKMKFVEISDRLIEDTNRRNKGEFYTPTLFVDYTHDMISEVLGENWKDEYVVWDNCCGTKNLTRDYRFKELYCSTLEEAELKMSEKYNPEATCFQFDFLNGWLEELPKGLLEAFEQNKKIVFFFNPPYAVPGGVSKVEKGNSNTQIKREMEEEGIDGIQLIKQFLYRSMDIKRKYNLKNFYIACFTNASWMIKPKSEKFRKLFFDNFKYENGIMFCASEFGTVSDRWGITFNIWSCGKQKDKNNFKHTLVENRNGEIVKFGYKTLYNYDNEDVLDTTKFVTNKLTKKYPKEILTCSNIKKMIFEPKMINVCDNYLTFIHIEGNDISNNNWTCIMDECKEGHRKPVTIQNIYEASIVYTIRRIVEDTWINDKDMYNMNVQIPEEFKNDCLIYATFGNYCCSIKQNEHILNNEFFWMSKSEIEELSNEHNNDICFSDVHTSPERFVYTKLQSITLSPEAQLVLDKANEIVRKTFKYRPLFDSEHPEYQINNWDCGWYQIKALAKEYAKDELNEFKKLYKALADKMRPMVYELGFLK